MVLAYFLITNTVYLCTTLFAFKVLKNYTRNRENIYIEDLAGGASAPPITLIAPAYNEEATCVESVRSLLTLIYPDYEILMVNDGSKDSTVQRLIEAYEMTPASRAKTAEIVCGKVREVYKSSRHPNLWLIDKENGGKADALNCGLNFCRTPLFCAMDADSLLERNALIKIVRPYLEDTTTIAAGGVIRIVNGCTVDAGVVMDIQMPKKWIERFQVLEYLRAFLSGRMGWAYLESTLIISGAFGLFQREAAADAGGFRKDTIGEDMELIVRLHRSCRENNIPYRITFVPDPVAWTECPSTLRVLGRQRDRWQRGLNDALLIHKKMLFNPRYGRIGMFAFPYFFFFEMLGPVIELFGYGAFAIAVAYGRVDGLFMLAFFMAAFVYGVALSIAAVGLEELSFRRHPKLTDLLLLFSLAVLENFGYRQILIFWRLKGALLFFKRSKSWGEMEHHGFKTAAAKS
ncbi:MAG: glycosyl transferase [Elusimicrobia bacterium RIFCSPLOWO2_01_FULL_54_10]|nr:MAG: glycosyl transferase [Elusimicrobia bacterium RIFCSPLOWO2_01_FULL_54_10]